MAKGGRYRSSFVTKMAFGSYNSHYPKSEGKLAWLTRDVQTVSGKYTDKYASFKFTLAAYRDLFDMIARSNSSEWFSKYPEELPTLIVSGTDDPVGNYGKGPTYVYKKLLMARRSKISLKLYEGARHELFNETNRNEVFSDLLAWIDGVVK
jgi:alpha-beta hydrolase superfamily lysophospholipase